MDTVLNQNKNNKFETVDSPFTVQFTGRHRRTDVLSLNLSLVRKQTQLSLAGSSELAITKTCVRFSTTANNILISLDLKPQT